MDREISMNPTPMQVFLACLDFLLFIVLGVVFIRQWMIFRLLKNTYKMQRETQRLLDIERRKWLENKFGVKEIDIDKR